MKQSFRVLVAILVGFGSLHVLDARGAKRYLKKETTVDMRNMSRIFIGWVDLRPEDWVLHGYSTQSEWTEAVNGLNSVFQQSFRSKYVPGRTVTTAKEKGDENAAGCDLYIKVADVMIDYDNYYIYASLDFIDPKTNSELGVIPTRAYYGNAWGFVNYLRAALDEVNLKLSVEITGELPKKRK
jgi:hypothetical protein